MSNVEKSRSCRLDENSAPAVTVLRGQDSLAGVGNPEIGFRSLPIAVLMNKYTLTDLLQTRPPMHHTVPSPPAPPRPPAVSELRNLSICPSKDADPKPMRDLTVQRNLQEGTHRIHVRRNAKTRRRGKTNPERSRERPPSGFDAALCVYFWRGACHYPSGWWVKDFRSGDPFCNGQHSGCRSQDRVPGFHEDTLTVGKPRLPSFFGALQKSFWMDPTCARVPKVYHCKRP